MRDPAVAGPVQPHEQAAFEAWALLLRAHATLSGGLDAALREQAAMTLGAYDLLAHVASAPERRIRMHDLERKVLFSQSTVSRLASRLEREGLLERVVAEDDRRALVVRLTGAGARGAPGAPPRPPPRPAPPGDPRPRLPPPPPGYPPLPRPRPPRPPRQPP